MGAQYNASMSLGNTVASNSLTLSSSLDAAFWPAITNKAGERDVDGVKKLCYMSMRISTVLVLIFAVPLALEIREVLRLWLVNPPDFTAEICMILLIRAVFERMTMAYATAIYGYGNGMMKYSWTVGWAGICTVFVSWLFFAIGFKMWSIIIGLSVSKLITVGVRLWMGRYLIGFGFWRWMKEVFIPVLMLSAIMILGGVSVRLVMQASFVRVIVTALVCEMLFVPSCWFFMFKQAEREYLQNRIGRLLSRGKGK